ncbi:MAG: tetratricopeptide repeat protein [Candidatus Omnitrophota bacterium]|nr:tetratricopeptide repeat protein [Candidatus Omnitrophota bacterium]
MKKEKTKNSVIEKRIPHYIIIILLFLTGLVAYKGAFIKGIFLFDDQALIVDNPFIKDFSHIKDVFTTHLFKGSGVYSNFYRPMQAFSAMIEYHFWGLKPFGYHLVNVVIHMLTSIAVYFFGYILSKRQIVGITAGLLFSVHTVLSGPVHYISARADLLMALFSVIAINFYMLYRETKTRGVLFYGVSFLSFLAAILSKETAVMVPFLALFYLYCFSDRRANLENRKPNLLWPFFIVIALYGWLRFTALDFSEGKLIETTTGVLPMHIRLLTTSKVLMLYLRLLVLPVGLHMEWDIAPAVSFFQDEVFLSIVGLLIIAGFIYFLFRNSRLKFFAIGWFFITLIPYLNIFPINYFMGEGWLYVPCIGFFILIGLYLSELGSRSKFLSWAVIFILLSFTLFYGALTCRRAYVWADPARLYKEVLKYSPNNTKARINLGMILAKSGDREEAIKRYNEVAKITPNDSGAHANLGSLYAEKKMNDKAMEEFKKAVELNPKDYVAHNNIGILYKMKGDIKKAMEEYTKALELNPSYPLTYNNIGNIYLDSRQYEAAIRFYNKAISIDPNKAAFYSNLGKAYKAKRMPEKAREAFGKALQLEPGHKEAVSELKTIR